MTLEHEFDEALMALLAEWDSDRDLEIRVNNLKDGSGSDDRLNGSYFLQKEATVFVDGDRDYMIGSSGRDWLLFFDLDRPSWWWEYFLVRNLIKLKTNSKTLSLGASN